jgi:3-oxoacyl-(acyl-carrier-protein) synthase
VVGVDVLTAWGDLRGTWNASKTFEPALAPPRGFDASGFEGLRAAQIAPRSDDGEDDPAERILGQHGRVLDVCARNAHARARGTEIPRDEVGLYVATGMIDSAVEDLAPAAIASRRSGEAGVDLARFFESGFRSIHPLWPLSMLNNVSVGQVATDLDVRGDNLVLGSEADAGVAAFVEAMAALEQGAIRLAIVGGVSERVCPASLARRRLAGVTAPPGEGCGVLVLEHPASALKRRVEPLAWLGAAATAFGEDAGARVACEVMTTAGEARPYEVPVEWLGDLGAGGPAVHAALVAFLFSVSILVPKPGLHPPPPRWMIEARSSAGGAGAMVLEKIVRGGS